MLEAREVLDRGSQEYGQGIGRVGAREAVPFISEDSTGGWLQDTATSADHRFE
jgi:hypothetical protein